MGLIEDCKKYFGSTSLYEVLGIQKDASLAQIKKAYRKASLLVHPDRNAGDEQCEATRKFQVVSKVHLILTDTEKRAEYDETGMVDEENCVSGDESADFWIQYWRTLFPKITTKDIENFMDKYKGSQEEIEDLKDCYVKYEGDIRKMSDSLIGYDVDDEERLRSILMDLINKEEIPSFPKFVNESESKRAARMKKLRATAKREAEECKREMVDSDLATALLQRSQARESNFNNLMKNLEDKYCKKETKGRKKK